jgi:hypothetical protein
MSTVKLLIKTADQTHKAEINPPRTYTGEEVIQMAIAAWKLPSDTEYSLVNTSSGISIAPSQALSEDIVKDADTLEVQPVLVAG